MDETKYSHRLILALDHLFNVLLGGKLGICFSTRAYIQAKQSKNWNRVRKVINFIFWKNHCRDSYVWELRRIKRWTEQHKDM